MVRGKTRSLARPKTEFDIRTKIHNRFDVEVVDARTGKVRQTCRGHNVICNQLWTNWFLRAAWNSYIFYGSGEGTPTAADTALFNRIGYAASSVHAVDSNSDEHWVSYTKKIQISESTAVGAKITEVGIAYGSTETNLCTHAMLEDMNGNTISIEKTDTDIINIYATVFVHWTPTPAVKIFGYWKDSPADKGLGAFAGLASSPFYNYGAFITKGILSHGFDTQYPDGYVSFSTSIDTANKSFTATFNRLSVSQHNTKGLHHMVLYYLAQTKESYPFTYHLLKPWASIEFPSDQVAVVPVVGEAVGTGDGVTTQFVTKFPHAQNATVYVDGVKVSGVTVNPNTFPKDYTMRDYLEEVWISGAGGNTAFNSISKEGFNSDSFEDRFHASSGEVYVFYNPHYEIGIASAYVYGVDMYASNDLKTWESVFVNLDSWGNQTIPERFVHYKYWKLNCRGSYGDWTFQNMSSPSTYNSNNIIFDVAPAEGSVITIDYTPQCIPKDENHVFDLSVTFHFGEYSDN